MAEVETDFGKICVDFLQKDGNDAEKFLSIVANALKATTDFFDDAEHKRRILNKCFDCTATMTNTTVSKNQPDNDAIDQHESNTVNEQSMNDSVGRILVPATQYNADESSRDSNSSNDLVVDESTVMHEEKDDGGAEDDDDYEIIPETQYAPDQVSTDGDSRPVSRVSSHHSFGHSADEKHVRFAVEDRMLDLVDGKNKSLNESNCDESDELIHVNQETNSSWPLMDDSIGASQAVIGHLDTEISNAFRNDRLTDPINLSSSSVENANKMDAVAANVSVTKPNTTAQWTGLEADANTTAASFSSCREVDRSTSSTPDLDVFSTPMVAASSSGAARSSFDARSSTPDFCATKASQATEVPTAPSIIDERSSTPDLNLTQTNDISAAPTKRSEYSWFSSPAKNDPTASRVVDERTSTPDSNTTNPSKANDNATTPKDSDERSSIHELNAANSSSTKNIPTASGIIDTSAVEMNDDSYSNDNELLDDSAQIIPVPSPQPLRVNNRNQASNVSASKLDDGESPNNNRTEVEQANGATATATVAADVSNALENDPHPNGNIVDEDEDSNGFYGAATQMNPFVTVASSNPASKRVAPTSDSSSKENSPNKSANNGMGPPTMSNKYRKTNPIEKATSTSNNEAGHDIFTAATQEFIAVSISKETVPSKKDSTSSAAGSRDAIYDLKTQFLSPPNSSAKKNRSSITVDSEDIWPSGTPQTSVAAKMTLQDIENYDRLSSKKPKTLLSKKWLFESEQEGENDIDEESIVLPTKKPKKSTEKRKADKVETVTSESAKKVKATKKTPTGPTVSATEMERIRRRRVSVVLERMNFDENSNVSSASEKEPKTPKRSARQHHLSNENLSDSGRKSRGTEKKAKSNKNTDRTVSDVTPNRAARAAARAKVVGASFEIPKSRSGTRGETRGATANESRSESSSESRSNSRSTTRNAVPLVPASSSELSRLGRRSDTRSDSSDRRSDTRTTTAVESRITARRASTAIAPKHRIMFTKVDMERRDIKSAVKYIPKLGGEMVDCATECTVLVCEKIYRTNKLMSAVGRGIPIVVPEWLIASKSQKRFVDTEPYQLKDVDNEKRFSFNLRSSLEMARKRPLYEGYMVFTTPNIVPPPHEIATIVECGGGVCSANYHQQFSSKLQKFVVSSTTDALMWKKIRLVHPNIPIINTEGIMRNVMQQKIDFSGHKLWK